MSHPYTHLPDTSYWRRSFNNVPTGEVDPVVNSAFTITEKTRVSTAGSCFAQHLARHLQRHKLNFFVTEHAHPLYGRKLGHEANYGVFPARFGNIYTARQLLQLFKRAFGMFTAREDVWVNDGRYVDPFRPQIQPGGFSTEREYWADRAFHYGCVRKMFRELDVFIFTLGLTEAWAAEDGAVFPVCPGVAGGSYDRERHRFCNHSFEEIVGDLLEFARLLKKENAMARLLLTVSPVPLVATMEKRHVLVSTVFSKSVLRVAAQRVVDTLDYVDYFPSYEIVTGAFNRGRYFLDDFREVHPEAVKHVMRLFMKHYVAANVDNPNANGPVAVDLESGVVFEKQMTEYVKVLCDEEKLDDPSIGSGPRYSIGATRQVT